MAKATTRRSYDQFCAVARALDHVSERWTLLIVRNLMLGPRRYSDLLAELPGITTNLLAARLRAMEASGIIARAPGPPPRYELTALGAGLEPVVVELGRWGAAFMDQPRRDDTSNVGWGLLSLKRRYRGGVRAVVEFRVEPRTAEAAVRRFELAFEEARLHVKEREAIRPQLVVSGALEAFQAWLFKDVAATSLQRDGKLAVGGDAAVWRAVQAALGPNDWKGARAAPAA